MEGPVRGQGRGARRTTGHGAGSVATWDCCDRGLVRYSGGSSEVVVAFPSAFLEDSRHGERLCSPRGLPGPHAATVLPPERCAPSHPTASRAWASGRAAAARLGLPDTGPRDHSHGAKCWKGSSTWRNRPDAGLPGTAAQVALTRYHVQPPATARLPQEAAGDGPQHPQDSPGQVHTRASLGRSGQLGYEAEVCQLEGDTELKAGHGRQWGAERAVGEERGQQAELEGTRGAEHKWPAPPGWCPQPRSHMATQEQDPRVVGFLGWEPQEIPVPSTA